MKEDKPLLEENTRFKLYDSGDMLVILDVWVDEDGNAQVRVNDNFHEKRTLTPEDIYDRLSREGFEKRESLTHEEKHYR